MTPSPSRPALRVLSLAVAALSLFGCAEDGSSLALRSGDAQAQGEVELCGPIEPEVTDSALMQLDETWPPGTIPETFHVSMSPEQAMESRSDLQDRIIAVHDDMRHELGMECSVFDIPAGFEYELEIDFEGLSGNPATEAECESLKAQMRMLLDMVRQIEAALRACHEGGGCGTAKLHSLFTLWEMHMETYRGLVQVYRDEGC